MKKYSLVFLLASAMTLGSCSDFLDRDPLSQASENTFWQTEADALAGVNALYPLLPIHATSGEIAKATTH